MNLHITKSKNAESFYICKSYVKANGSTTSTIVCKLGTLEQLLPEHGPTRDDVVAWARNEAKIETEKYKKGFLADACEALFYQMIKRLMNCQRKLFLLTGPNWKHVQTNILLSGKISRKMGGENVPEDAGTRNIWNCFDVFRNDRLSTTGIQPAFRGGIVIARQIRMLHVYAYER